MSLRELGIYCLPNGRELVVLRKNGSSTEELRLGGWGHFKETEYVVNEVGRMISEGKLTAWDIKDLTDTGRTAGY